MTEVLREQIPNEDDLATPLILLKCKRDVPDTDWRRSWRLVRMKGLGSEITSFMMKTLWRVIPTRSRLQRMMPAVYQSPDCQQCGTAQTRTPETLAHALYTCKANRRLPDKLLSVLQTPTRCGATHDPYSGPRPGAPPRAPLHMGDRHDPILDLDPKGN